MKVDVNNIKYELCPGNSAGGMQRWIEYGLAPGGFLSAVIRNDLRNACAQADETNKGLLCQYVQWLYNEAPEGCWGSKEKFDKWQGTKRDPKFAPFLRVVQ